MARLFGDGAPGLLTRPPGWSDDAVWTGFATGQSMGEHGRFHGPYQFAPGTYVQRAFADAPQTDTTFWGRLAEDGYRCAVLDVPKCPIAPNMGLGFQIADWLVHAPDHKTPISSPEGKAAELLTRFGPKPPSPCGTYRIADNVLCHDGFSDDDAREWLGHILSSVAMKEAAAADVLQSGDWDLCCFVFKELHCAGHLFWDDADPDHPEHDPQRNARRGRPVETVFQRIDEAIGRLAALAGEDTDIVVFSPHGMRANHSQSAAGVELLARFDDMVVREIRSRMTPLARGLHAFRTRKQHQRARTAFFALPYNEQALAIRLNLEGREPHGLVPEGEAEAIRARLTEFLSDLRDETTGEKVVEEVIDFSVREPGPRSAELPDLVAVWSNHHATALVSSMIGASSFTSNRLRPGNHTETGFVLSQGPLSGDLSARDIAITDLGALIAGLVRSKPESVAPTAEASRDDTRPAKSTTPELAAPTKTPGARAERTG